MPGFRLAGRAEAAVEDVWKLLFDPTRFPEWWDGVETVRTEVGVARGTVEYVQWPTGYPDFPMPQVLRTDRDGSRVTISCQISDIEVAWRLSGSGPGTAIEVRVDLPEAEAHRVPSLKETITKSIAALAALAESESPVGDRGVPT